MWFIDGIADVWRILMGIVNFVCLIILANRFRVYRHTWKEETRDLWATLCLWSLAALITALQGLFQDHRPLSFALVFLSIASLATPLTLRRKTLERKRHEIP